MPSDLHPLAPLLAASLWYASAQKFARLNAVRNLSAQVNAALREATGRVDETILGVLRAELGRIDSTDEAIRRHSVLTVGRLIAAEVEGPKPQSPSPVGVEWVETGAPSKPAPVKRSKAAEPQERAPREPAKKKRGAATADDEDASCCSTGDVDCACLWAAGDSTEETGRSLEPPNGGCAEQEGAAEDRRHSLHVAAGLRRSAPAEDHRADRIRRARRCSIAEVRNIEESFGRGRRQFGAILGDSSGTIAAVHFQAGPWLKAKYPLGKKLVVSGEVRQSLRGWEIAHPEVEPDDVDASPVHFNRLVLVYPGSSGMSNAVCASWPSCSRSGSATALKNHCLTH